MTDKTYTAKQVEKVVRDARDSAYPREELDVTQAVGMLDAYAATLRQPRTVSDEDVERACIAASFTEVPGWIYVPWEKFSDELKDGQRLWIRAALESLPAQPIVQAGAVDDGIARAAAYIQKKADDYAAENCGMEPDTGATTYHYGLAGAEYRHTLLELAEEIAALARPASSGKVVAWPRVYGVSRDGENSRVLLVSFAGEPTDAELRAFHDAVIHPAEPVKVPGEWRDEIAAILDDNEAGRPPTTHWLCNSCGRWTPNGHPEAHEHKEDCAAAAEWKERLNWRKRLCTLLANAPGTDGEAQS